MLGLTLGHRLARAGHTVEIFESGGQSGGLAAPHDYGSFVWDRYYHCILPQDQNLIRLLAELGLEDDLRWRTTGTGYYGKGVFHNMSGNKDFLAFPLLSLADKFRLGATIFYATRFADPYKLYRVTAKDWLTRTCGRKVYEVFWLPLLKAKFGPFHDQIAAVFIWATLTRLFGARKGGANKENLGYVRGGYRAVLGKLEASLASHGAKLRLDSPIAAARPGRDGEAACVLETSGPEGECKTFGFDQVFFTAPTSLAAKVSAPEFQPHIRRMATDYPTSGAYLGVICLVLVLKKPLTPYYVLNIGEDLGLTGVIEMTNLIDAAGETGGSGLVYLPRYLDSADPAFSDSDEKVFREAVDGGLKRLFPDFSEKNDIVSYAVHRAPFVQPLPLARDGAAGVRGLPGLEGPFQILNTSMLQCATLNNNEVVGMVEEFMKANGEKIRA